MLNAPHMQPPVSGCCGRKHQLISGTKSLISTGGKAHRACGTASHRMFKWYKSPHRDRRHAAAAAAAAQQVEPVDQLFELCQVIGKLLALLEADKLERTAFVCMAAVVSAIYAHELVVELPNCVQTLESWSTRRSRNSLITL